MSHKSEDKNTNPEGGVSNNILNNITNHITNNKSNNFSSNTSNIINKSGPKNSFSKIEKEKENEISKSPKVKFSDTVMRKSPRKSNMFSLNDQIIT
jgi:hypothetical protein